MPADAFVDERHLPPLGLSNAWGYNAVVFGAPDPRLAPGGWAEVRAATDALHAAGMEAILDVVFNHNGESDQFGPTLSFRGLDNAAWFRLDPRDPALYINDTGTGNCLALDRPLVIDMAIGALRRWMIHGGFDGFRFDLAPSLGRRADGFDPKAPFFQALAADPILAEARLIAEPWDVGPGGYQLGQFGPAFAEWNDRFRDAARRFWRGDAGHARRDRNPDRGLARHLRARRGPVEGRQFRRRPRRLHPRATSSPTRTSTTRPTASTIATARTTTSAGTTASRVRATIRRSSRRARATSAIC